MPSDSNNKKIEEKLFHKGKECFKQANFQLADQCFKGCLELNYHVVESNFYLGVHHYYQFNFPEAFRYFQMVLSMDKENGETHYFLGKIYQSFQNEEASIAHFKTAIDLGKEEYVQILAFEEIEDLLDKKDRDKIQGEKVKEYLIQINIAEDDNLILEGLKCRLQKDYPKTIEYFSKLVELYPNYFLGYYFLAHTYLKNEEYDKAKKHFLFLKNKFHLSRLGVNELSKVAFKLGQYKESRNYLKQMLKINPSNSKVYYNLGITETLTKNYDKAIQNFEKSINLQSDFFPAIYNMAVVLQQVGRADEALTLYNKALGIIGDFPNIYYNMGLIYFVKNDYINALFNFTKAHQINPDFKEAVNNFNYISLLRILDESSTQKFEFSPVLKITILLMIAFFVLILLYFMGVI